MGGVQNKKKLGGGWNLKRLRNRKAPQCGVTTKKAVWEHLQMKLGARKGGGGTFEIFIPQIGGIREKGKD